MIKAVMTGLDFNSRSENLDPNQFSGLLGAIAGGAMPPMNPETTLSNPEDIDEETALAALTGEDETTDLNTVEMVPSINIISVSPYSIDIINNDKKIMIILTILGIDDDNLLYLINRSYYAENKEEIERIRKIPFYTSEDFNSVKTSQYILSKGCTVLQTNFEFYSTDDPDKFSLYALNIDDNNNKVHISVNANIMSCLAFFDLYVFKTITGLHSLNCACIAGINKDNEEATDTIIPDTVENLLCMAPVIQHKKIFGSNDTSDVIVAFKLIKMNGEEREAYSLLTPFNVGVSFPKQKFKGHTTKEIQETYFGDSDQYMSEYIVGSVHIYGCDKEFLMIVAKNKNKDRKVFMLSGDVQSLMIDKISDY